jgi:hypothetical protein
MFGPQENAYWLDRLLRAYQSRAYIGELKSSLQVITYFSMDIVECSLNKCLELLLGEKCAHYFIRRLKNNGEMQFGRKQLI